LCQIAELIAQFYAKTVMAITGIARITVLVTHQIESLFSRTLPFSSIIATTNASSPLIKAIKNAITQRLAHSDTSTGVEATAKKTTGMIEGRIT
jgi:hypothetical protein